MHLSQGAGETTEVLSFWRRLDESVTTWRWESWESKRGKRGGRTRKRGEWGDGGLESQTGLDLRGPSLLSSAGVKKEVEETRIISQKNHTMNNNKLKVSSSMI